MNDTILLCLTLSSTWDEGETQSWRGGRAMALIFFNLATKLQKSQTLQFFPFILRSPLILHSLLSSSSSSSFPSPSSIHDFSSATSPPPPLLSSPSHTNLLPNHHSSSLKPSLTQNPHKEITFAVERDETFNSTDFPTIDSSFLQILTRTKQFSEEEEDSLGFLDKSGVRPTEGLVCSAIWAVRNEWELAFLVFKWGDKWSCCDSKAWDLMIWVLGKHQKFSIAWGLIRSMIQSSMDARPPMLIMIQSYAAANSPEKAIRTFQAMEKFRITRDTKAFYYLLSALCKHGDVELAEEFMLLNKNFFPLKTESFNIILNGWCNISLDVIEAKRIWREMSNRCITPDATTYTCMISCFSKVGNLFDSLRLYDEMKKRGWIPGLIVYNSLVYVLTRENCLADALKILDKIKEAGLQPDSTTYNSIIVPLCEAQKLEEAHMILANMAREGLEPNILTYHAFIEGESFEETLDLLKQMRKSGCGPNGHTFLLILLKFLKLKQPENTLKMWAEMENYEVVPDSAHYRSLVGGLAECGWLVKAKEFNDEMKSKGFIDDPKIEKLLKELIGNNVGKGKQKKNIQVSRRKR